MSTKLGTLTLDLVAKIGNFVEPMKKAGDTTQRESKRIESSINSASKAIVALGATALAGLTVSAVIESADAYTQMAARIRNATKDTAEYDLVQNRLLNTANGTYRALSEAQEVYLGLSGGLKELGYNTNQVLNISDSLSYSFVHNATSADKAQSAMSAYGKVLDKGKVDADAWFSIMAATPNVLDDVAKASGKSAQEIRKLGAEGKLSVDDLNKGLLQSRDANQALADAMENSLADGLVAVKNGFSVLVGEANKATGATNTLAAGLATVGDVLVLASDNLDVLAVAGGTAATVLALKMTPAIILSGKSFAISSIESVKYQVALARMAAQAGGTTTALTLLGGVARGALSILGGPVGLILTVASVAASYALFRDNTKSSTVSLRENNESVEDAIKKYTELSEAKRNAQIVSEKDELKKLGDEYGSLSEKLVIAAFALSRHNDMTTEQSKHVNDLIAEYKKTGDIDNFSSKINALGFVSQESKNHISILSGSVSDASEKFKTHKTYVDSLINLGPKLAKANDEVTNSVNRQKNAYQSLSEQQKKVYDSISQDLSRERYIQANVSQGIMSREKAEHFADKREQAGIAYNERMSKEMFLQVDASWKLKQNTDNRVEAEKKVLEQQKKQLELAEKTVKSQTIDSVIAKGEGNYNSVNLGQKYDYKSSTRNLTGMSVGDVLIAQTKKEFNAAGKYQVLPATLKGAIDSGIVSVSEKFNEQVQERIVQNYLLTAKKNRKSVEDFIKGKSNDVVSANLDLSKEFASIANPATGKSHYAGVENNKALISAKEAQNALKASRSLYATAIATGKSAEEAWKAAFNGSFTFVEDSDVQKALEVVLDAQNDMEQVRLQALERQKTVQQTYFTEEQAMAVANAEARKEIEEAFAGDNEAITKYLLLQEIAYEKDVKAFKAAQQQKIASAYEAIHNPLSEMQNIGMNAAATATLNPMEYQKWDLNNQQQTGYSQLSDSFLLTQQSINDSEYTSETEKYAQLEALYDNYLQNKAALSEQYAKQELDLAQQQKLEQFNLWGSVLNQAQNSFAQLTQSAKDSAGEQSSVYRTMFAMQQAFSIASSMAAAYTAYTQAFADPSAMTLPQKVAGGATVMAALMPAITTLSSLSINGMAHDGIDNVPKEGTWLLDKGERVVDSRTNADLKNYLSHQKQQAPKITINNNANADVTTRQNADGSIDIDLIERQLANRLGSANSVLSKSLKQNTTASRRR